MIRAKPIVPVPRIFTPEAIVGINPFSSNTFGFTTDCGAKNRANVPTFTTSDFVFNEANPRAFGMDNICLRNPSNFNPARPPERALWPFAPRPEYVPLLPNPRPTVLRSFRAPLFDLIVCSCNVIQFLFSLQISLQNFFQ